MSRLFHFTYECVCGNVWKCWNVRYAKDECQKCKRHVDPKDQIQ